MQYENQTNIQPNADVTNSQSDNPDMSSNIEIYRNISMNIIIQNPEPSIDYTDDKQTKIIHEVISLLDELEKKGYRNEINKYDDFLNIIDFFIKYLNNCTDDVLKLISKFFLENVPKPSTIVWGLGGYVECLKPFYNLIDMSKKHFEYLYDSSTKKNEKHIVLSLLKGIIYELIYQAIHLEDSDIEKPFNGMEIVSLLKCPECNVNIEFYHSSYRDGWCPKCRKFFEEKRVSQASLDLKKIKAGKITAEKNEEFKNDANRPYIVGHFPIKNNNNNNNNKGLLFVDRKHISVSIDTSKPLKNNLFQSFINFLKPDIIKANVNNPNAKIYNEIRTIISSIHNISSDQEIVFHVNEILRFLNIVLIGIWEENSNINISKFQDDLEQKCSKALKEIEETNLNCQKMLDSALKNLYAPPIPTKKRSYSEISPKETQNNEVNQEKLIKKEEETRNNEVNKETPNNRKRKADVLTKDLVQSPEIDDKMKEEIPVTNSDQNNNNNSETNTPNTKRPKLKPFKKSSEINNDKIVEKPPVKEMTPVNNKDQNNNNNSESIIPIRKRPNLKPLKKNRKKE